MCLGVESLIAQSTSTNFYLQNKEPFKIQVTNKATTVIAFPFAVLNADCGNGDLRADTVPGIPNIIKIKSAIPNLDTTNLHVYTADGTIHCFNVSFQPTPAITTYYLASDQELVSGDIPVLLTAGFTERELKDIVTTIRQHTPFMNHTRSKFELKLTLEAIYFHNRLLIFKFKIRNQSNIPYLPAWANLYMLDKVIAKRTSVQQLNLQPIYSDLLPEIPGKKEQSWIIAIPRTTIPNNKKMWLQLQEQNGGRRINISIRNKDIFRARAI